MGGSRGVVNTKKTSDLYSNKPDIGASKRSNSYTNMVISNVRPATGSQSPEYGSTENISSSNMTSNMTSNLKVNNSGVGTNFGRSNVGGNFGTQLPPSNMDFNFPTHNPSDPNLAYQYQFNTKSSGSQMRFGNNGKM
jgi:hypothetical protein